MPKYKVQVKRTECYIQEIDVEAANVFEAENTAYDLIDEHDWTENVPVSANEQVIEITRSV